ncbi:MAG: PLP-dependent aminotransferase family protein, partial [Thermomicrobiales bacterium]|nr:PLP-dependent aminotransferase family protein [Thermomicrobiales bacterium]
MAMGDGAVWPIDRDNLLEGDPATPRYALIAEALQRAIGAGALPVGARLPTVRQLATDLGVSVTTALAAYSRLNDAGWTQSEVGRGTFVLGPPGDEPREPNGAAVATVPPAAPRRPLPAAAPWRRRALVTSATRLRAAWPEAADCSSGRPAPALLPLAALQRAWGEAIASTTHADLQYSGPDPIAPLASQVVAQLAADGIAVAAADLVVGSSAQQFMVLALHVLAMTTDVPHLRIAVEEPGYPTIFDTYERLGYGLIGVEVDAAGAAPASLDAALAAGAHAVLLTPRAHNPTGASWSPQRLRDLADVLADHPRVLVIEDDQFAGIAVTRPGSLLNDQRLADRVIYVRSFSKSIAPDLRIAVAAAGPLLRRQLAEAKSLADGWSSRLAQRALAIALGDAELLAALDTARDAYAERRAAAAHALNTALGSAGGGAAVGDDGVNIWVHLPLGVDAARAVERAAALGVLVAPGEPFFIRPG